MAYPHLFVLTLMLSGCATISQQKSPIASERPSRAGFAIYLRHDDGRYATLLLDAPTDGTPAAPRRLDGLWVYDDASDHLGLAGLDACACPSACGAAAPAFRLADHIHKRLDACNDPPFLSLVGGTLFGVIEEVPDVCAGALNSYSSQGAEVTLGPAPYSPLSVPIQATHRYCDENFFMGAGDFTPAYTNCAQHLGTWNDDDPEQCQPCTEDINWSSEIPYLRGTNLVVVRDRRSSAGSGPRITDAFPLAPTSCPSAADPCGDPRLFLQVPEIKSALTPIDRDEFSSQHLAQPFWVTTDGRFALVLTTPGARAGAWQLWRRGETAPVSYPEDGATASTAPAELLGVRFHPHLRTLLDRVCAMTCPSPVDAATCADAIGAMDSCAPDAPLDQSCYDAGSSDDADEADYPVRSDDADEADYLVRSDDADEADDFVPDADPRDASALGNACFTAIKAGDLDEAESLCKRGLDRAENDRTRGALHFNLGLIAEHQGDRASARRAYETSLRLRPGNTTVQKRLDALR